MSKATVGEAETTIQNTVNAAYQFLASGGGNNLITKLTTANDAYTSDGISLADYTTATAAARQSAVSTWNALRGAMKLAMDDFGHAAGVDAITSAPSAEFFRTLRRYYSDKEEYAAGSVDKKVTARGWTRGAEATTDVSSTALTGSAFRLTVDEDGQDIETGFPQDLNFKVTSGPGQKDTILIEGEPAGQDVFQLLGAGPQTLTITSIDERNPGPALSNPTFNHGVTTSGSAVANTALSSWTTNNDTDWTSVVSTTTGGFGFRLGAGVATDDDGATLTQTLSNISAKEPYLFVAVVKPNTAFSGSIDLAWGSKTENFALANQNNTWTIIAIARDLDMFPLNWDQSAATAVLTANISAGGIQIGAFHALPMSRFRQGDACYHAAVTGNTEWTTGITWKISDTLAVSGKIQHVTTMMWPREPEAYWTTTGTNTLADPT